MIKRGPAMKVKLKIVRSIVFLLISVLFLGEFTIGVLDSSDFLFGYFRDPFAMYFTLTLGVVLACIAVIEMYLQFTKVDF